MKFICPKCANKTDFYRDDDITQWGNERRTVDEDGEIEDYGDFEFNDGETTETGTQMCNNCDIAADEVEDDEWEAWTGPEPETPKTWQERFK